MENRKKSDEEGYDAIDLEQILFNLALTPEQRILYHQSALDLIWEMKQAKPIDETKSQ